MLHRYKFLATVSLLIIISNAGVSLNTNTPPQPDSTKSPASAQHKLNISFLFHANQNLVPYGRVADRACFRGLIQTLLKHPSQKFQLHFSASLIHDLQWFGDTTLRLIRQGITAGQFEIFGSTYAQNIMYSTRTDTGDYEFNDHQIKFQRDLIEKVLGVEPKAFWNAERVWTQNFVQLLADNGYQYVPVEDHILLSSGATGPVYRPRVTRFNGRSVVAFEDDKTFLGLVDNAVNSGNPAPVMDYLHARYAEDTLEQYAIGYYQDAEATGLWDFENRVDPQTNFSGLDALLSAIERDTTIRVTSYAEWLATHPAPPELTPIVDGAAQWMGGNAWFAENQSTQFQTMRSVYDSLRTYIDSIATVIQTFAADTSADKLLQHAWFTLCAHQFEFGCHGLEGDIVHTQLQLARASAVAATAALYRLMPGNRIYQGDINRDGINEIVISTPKDLYVFSTNGGRLLYWFDLARGEEMIGNEDFSADYGETYVNDNLALPVIHGGQQTYSWLAGNPLIPEIFTWNFIVRKRALNDELSFNGGPATAMENLVYDPVLDSTGVTFDAGVYGIDVRKSIHPTATGLEVRYVLTSQLGTAMQTSMEIQNSFSPSLLAVMDNGRNSVAYIDGSGATSQAVSSTSVGVKNTITGSALRFQWGTIPDALSGREDVFGLELNPTFSRTLAAGDSTHWSFSIEKSTTSTDVPSRAANDVPRQMELYQNYPNPFNPKTGIRVLGSGDRDIKLVVYDLLGREVAVLANGRYPAGEHTFTFDGTNLATGIYFYRLTAGKFTASRSMLLMK